MTPNRGRHRKLRRNILHTVIVTALLSGTFTVVDQSVNTSTAIANEAGKVDSTFTASTTAAQSIAAFSDNSFVVGYATSPFVRRYSDTGSALTLTTAYPASAVALEVDRSTNYFVAGGQAANGHRSQTFSQSGSLLSLASSNNIIPQASSAVKISGGATYLGGGASSFWLGKYSNTLVANSAFNTNVEGTRQSADAIAVDSAGRVYFGGQYTTGVKRRTTTGAPDSGFTASSNPGIVSALEVDANDSVIAGSATAPYLYRYGSTGTLDTAFASAVGSTFNGKINSIKIHNNRIYVGGEFTGGLKRLYLDGTPDAVFNTNVAPSLTNTVKDIEIDPAGRVLVAYGAGVKRFVTADVTVPAAPTITSTVVKESSMQFNLTSSDVANTSRIVVSTVGVSPAKTCSISGTTGSCLVSGLTNGTPYNFEAKSYNGEVASAGTSSSGTPLDLPPLIQSATVDTTGKVVSLVFDQTLSSTTAQNTDFVLTLNGQTLNSSSGISGIVTSGATLNITLANAVQRNSSLTVGYNPPTNNPGLSNQAIQDTNGNDTQSFTNFATTNNSTIADTLPPVLTALAVNSAGKIVLTYDENLMALDPNASAFTVSINGSTQKSVNGQLQNIVVSNTMVISGSTLTLDFNWGVTIEAGDVVTIAYANTSNPATNNRAIQDSSGNDSAAFSATTITTNNSSVDLVKPTFSSATLNSTGTKVTLTYNEALNANAAATSAFSVLVNGVANSVTAVNTVGSTVELTLASVVEANKTVMVSYTAPASNNAASNFATQDVSGNDALSLSSTAVTNTSTIDTTAPVYSTSMVNAAGTKVILTFDEALNSTTAPTSTYSMLVDGVSNPVSSVAVIGSTIELTLTTVVQARTTVTVAYAAPGSNVSTSNAAIQDLLGNDSVSIAATTVTNSSTQDQTPPILNSASVGASGTTLVLWYNESLNVTNKPGTSAFVVTINGSPVSVSSVTVNGSTVSLLLGTTVNGGQAVTVAYTPPTPDTATTNAAIQDTTGNDAADIANTFAVTNSSTQGPPALTGGTVLASGTAVNLNFSQSITGYNNFSPLNFTIYANGSPVKCSAFGMGNPLPLTNCSPTIQAGATITASYSPAAGSSISGSGGTVLPFSDIALTNSSTQPADVVAPTLNSITMPGTNGQTIVLTYDENMGGVAPDRNAFTILVDGVASLVSSVSVVGQQVTLTMSPPIEINQTVSVAYLAPTPSNNWANVAAIQDVSGNDALSISQTSIPNTSTAVVDRVAPVFQSAATSSNGTQIILTYNEALSSQTALPSDYSITLNGMTFSPTAVSISGSTVVLTVGTNIVSGEIVSVSYAAPIPSGLTTNPALQDLSGNDGVSLSNVAVTNISNSQPDLTPPTVSTVTFSGTQVTLTLSEPLSSTSALPERFTIFAGDNPVTPTGVTVSGQNIVLTVPTAISSGTVIAVSYTAPIPAISNSSNQALQDLRGNDAASFNVTTQPNGTSWEWVGGTPTQSCPGAGSAYPNSSKSKLLPNGVTYTVAVTGYYLCIDSATESLSERGGQAGDFQSVGLVTEPGLKMWTSNNGCTATQLIGRCDNRGVMTISFSKPVTNPVVSFAGWGGGNNGAGWSEMKLLTPGATLTALAGTNIAISQNGTVVGNVDGTVPSIGCHKTNGYGANAQAVCGSLQIEGVYTSVSFQVNYEYAASNTGSDGGNEDAWNLTASIPEDFGMVPSSYDNPVASHALGSLKLGSVVTADNPSSLYATTNADSVASGTEIKAGALNVSNQNVVTDDGVAQSSWSGLVDNRDGETFTIPVTLAGVAETANLCAWIDFNRDNVFTASERACATRPAVGQTSANISWIIPSDITAGLTYARVRISYDSLPLPSGKVGSGEVEDYSLTIASSAIPSATSDNSIAGKDVNQTISPLANDQFQAGVGNDITKMFLCLPAQTPMNCTIGVGQSLTIPNQGTYTLNANGTVTFDPVPAFTGTATPIKYQIADAQSRTSSSTINPVVIPVPVGVPDVSLGDYDKDQIIDPLINDTPGSTNHPLVRSTLKLCAVDNPATTGVNETQLPNNCSASSVSIPGEGTYTLNADGTVTFNPLPTFFGTVATPVKYQAQDSLGQFENSIITPTVSEPPTVTATNDVSVGDYDANQIIAILQNDNSDGNEQTLKPETVKLCNPATTPPQTSPNCNLLVLTTSDGTYTVNSDGTVTFNPLPSFTGTVTTPVVYQVSDALDREVSANIKPTVGLPPTPSALPETSSGPYNTPQSTVPLTNETPGSSAFPLSQSALKLCAVDEAATPLTDEAEIPNDCSATSVTIPGEGTYSYDAVTGRITFTPLATFTGPATPIVYQTNDSLNRFVDSTYTPTVDMPPPPAADDETSTGAFNTAQAPIDVLLGDTPGDLAAPLVPATLRLCDPSTTPAQTGAACDKTSVTTADGTYKIVDGKVVFTPATDFHGAATPIDYIVKDSLGQVAQGTISPTVNKPTPPTADPETKSVLPGDSISFTAVTGDDGLASGTDLDPASVCLVADAKTTPSTGCVTSLTTADGTWSVDPATGVISYTSTGSTPGNQQPVTYRVTDVAGQSATDTLTPVIPPPPAADDETSTGAFNTAQAPIDVLLGDTPGDLAAPLDPATLRLCDPLTTPAQTGAACDKTSVTTADGTYKIVDGKVVFTPATDFHGAATPIDYIVKDSLGQVAQGTISPTVIALPTANPDTSSGPQGVAQSRNVVTNSVGTSDTAASGTTLVASTVTLSCGSAPDCTRNVNGTVTIAGQGTYSASAANGTVVFTPLPDFSGEATPVTYTVSDALGQSATTTYTPTVIPAPVAVNDTSTNGQDKNQLINVLDNDTVPTNPAGNPLDPTSVKLCGINPVQTPAACNKLTLTTADGTYTVNPTTGVVTFDPLPTFTGTVTVPVEYQVSDTGATPQTTSALITPIVIPGPTAANDTSSGPMNTPQTKSLVANDSASSGATLDVSTVKLCAVANPSATPPVTAEVAPNCTKTSVTVPNVGTYSVDAAGLMTFTPVTGYTGTPTALSYTVEDNFGVKAKATYTPKVIPPPTVVPDTSTGPWDTNQIRNVVTNTVNTGDSAATGATLVAGSIRLCAPTDTAPNCSIDASGSVEIPGQGTYTVDPATNEITFDPLPTFTGPATAVRYSVTDDLGQKSSTTYTPTVSKPPAPTADPETTKGPKGASQTIDLLPGDATSAAGITLVPSSVRLCPAATTTPQIATACTLTTLTVSGVGTYTVVDGVMTFTPLPNYVGTPPAVVYQVTDSVGGKASSTYTPKVIPPPTVVPDTSTGPWDTNQIRNVVTNTVNTGDSAGTGATLAAGSIRLCAPNDTAPDCTIDASGSVVISGQGTYTVNPATNEITFDPLPTWTGQATAVRYSVTDDLGQKSSTTYTPTVTVPPVPTSSPDTITLIAGSSKAFSSIFDAGTGDSDPALATKGAGGPDLTNSSVCLLTPGTSVCDADGIVTIAGQGTYTLDPATGIVTYAADANAPAGAKTAVTYKITDGLGRSVTNTLTPTITPRPVANPDTSTGVQGAVQTLSPVGNDRPGGGASTELYPDTRAQIPSGIFLCAANQPPPDCAASTVTVTDPVSGAVLGVLTVAATGLVTFTPEPDFIGTTPPIGYQLPDNLGQMAYSTITITVVPPPAPSATIDTGSAAYNRPVTLKPWMNDAAGTVPAGSSFQAPRLIATSIKLCADNSTFIAMLATPDCTATKIQTVEGTYEVNATTGEVVFTPVDGFTGTVNYPPTYQIWNNWSGPGGAKSATALLVPTISPPGAPAATVDVTKTKPGTSVELNPVANDKPGTAALDPTSIRLCGAGEISPACAQMEVTTLDGRYVVDPGSGKVTFTPRAGFIGRATIPYVIADGLGMMTNANLIITVEDTAVVPPPSKKPGLAKTGGHRPDLLLILGIMAMVGAGGLRIASRKR